MLDISSIIVGFYGSISVKISHFLTIYLPKLFILFWEVLRRVSAWFAAHYIRAIARLKLKK